MRRTILFSLLFLSCNVLFGQQAFEYIYRYPPTGITSGSSVEVLNDGYLIAGTSNSSGAGQNDVLVIKTDLNGNSVWKKTYGSSSNDYGKKIRKLSDGNYIVAGTTWSMPADSADFYIIKTDTAGNLLWAKTWGGSRIDSITNFIETADGNILVIGATTSLGAGKRDMCLLKLGSSNGNISWSKILGNTGNDVPTALIELGDHGFLISGYTDGFGFTGNTPLLMKVDSSGNLQWLKIYNPSVTYSAKDCRANDIMRGYHNDFVIVGTLGRDGVGAASFLLADLDSSGNVNWSTSILYNSGAASAKTVSKTSDGQFIIGGSCAWSPSATLLKTDTLGQPVWVWAYYGTDVLEVKMTNDYQYIATGPYTGRAFVIKPEPNGVLRCSNQSPFFAGNYSYTPIITSPTFLAVSPSFTSADSCIVNTSNISDSSLCLYTSIYETEMADNFVSVFPNPANSSFTIESELQNAEVKIYETTGRLIFATSLNSKFQNLNPNLSSGIYFIRVTDGEKVFTQKLVVE